MSVVFPEPERVGNLVTTHAHWVADNGVETAAFATRCEAVAFCRKRWRSEPRVLASMAEYDAALRRAAHTPSLSEETK